MPSGRVIREIPKFENILSSVAKKVTDIARNLGKAFMDKISLTFMDKIDKFNKEYISGKDSGITLTNNKIRDTMKVIKSLEKRGFLLKRATK